VRVLSRKQLAEQATLLAENAFCQKPADIAAKLLDRLLPRESLTTLEYSLQRRIIRKPDGAVTNWSQELSPFAPPVMAALDDPEVFEVVMPKPARTGGTVIAENHALKRLDLDRNGDVMWYLAGPKEVTSYADRILGPLFDDHEGLAKRLPKSGTKGNTGTIKKPGSQTFELLVMSGSTTTNRQAAFIVFDEPDSYSKAYRSNFIEQGRQRQRMLGNDRKIYACAHPDIGWSGGISAAWVLSSQGIWVMKCPECGCHASPYPTKYWPEVLRFRLDYTKSPEGTPIDQRLALAGRTAFIACPHNGCALNEEQRVRMVQEGAFMHKGQELDIKAGIVGEPEKNRTWGFWVHVLMSPQVAMAELAREIEGALEHKERTGKSDKLKQVMVRTFGEVFEGAGDAAGLDARALKQRTKELAESEAAGPVGFRMGSVPDGVLFVTLAVDVGGNKFDLLFRGWDRQRRSWLIDRRTIRQRLHSDGVLRDIAPAKDQEDWQVLEAEIDRLLPLLADPARALPVACTVIDASDGNVTWKAYEFARRMDKKRWHNWRKVHPIKGATTANAEPLPPKATMISKDNEGKAIEPHVGLWVLGVHKLKEEVLGDLAIDDRAPGQVFFPRNFPDKAYEELFNEVLVDKAWVRNGPNETLDLMGYAEAARLMLQPDRATIKWDDPDGRPIWAQPVSLQIEGGDPDRGGEVAAPAQAKPKTNIMERFERLNR
jgi:phage terminase large subunit GpA-like protein